LINGKVTGVPPVRSFRLGRRVLFKREWIDAWIEAAAQDEAREC
jgi:predicted DNA-binding transcriptional regulator AlpA